MDADLDGLTREQLIAEVRKLRDGIRKHRDSSGQELSPGAPRTHQEYDDR